mmetsp:Transcript_54463/g.137531  ORF Transcript_54463/g.137531 Transcript_54463/m.137531 type:complete len:355 (+) Transcript_54463:54-1118(+)
MATTLKRIVIIGGTGAQGAPIVQSLSESRRYEVVVMTRNARSRTAQSLANLPNVLLFEGQYTDEDIVRKAFVGAYGAFVNTDGHTLGEKAEIFVGMRIFELAVEAGIKHYIYSGLFNSLKYGGYDPKFRCGHTDGKARVSEWLLAQQGSRTTPSILTTGPYINMLQDGMFMPQVKNDGQLLEFTQPLGPFGKIPMVALEDVGVYTLWLFDNFERAAFLDLQVAMAHVDFRDVVCAFNELQEERQGSKRAVWKPFDDVSSFLDSFGAPRDLPLTAVFQSDGAGMTFHENFTGWWNLFRANLLERDYQLLDEIHPQRIRSVREWMDLTGYDGTLRQVLKDQWLGSPALQETHLGGA